MLQRKQKEEYESFVFLFVNFVFGRGLLCTPRKKKKTKKKEKKTLKKKKVHIRAETKKKHTLSPC
jgi:hypothetical protein